MKLKTVINITRIVRVLNKMYTAAKKLDRRYILAVDLLYLHLFIYWKVWLVLVSAQWN